MKTTSGKEKETVRFFQENLSPHNWTTTKGFTSKVKSHEPKDANVDCHSLQTELTKGFKDGTDGTTIAHRKEPQLRMGVF